MKMTTKGLFFIKTKKAVSNAKANNKIIRNLSYLLFYQKQYPVSFPIRKFNISWLARFTINSIVEAPGNTYYF